MDLRKERTLKLLNDAFVELIHEESIDRITVSELCDRAMIRRATFYRHFESKEAFVAHFIRGQRAAISEQVLAEKPAQSCEEYCRRMTKRLVELVIEHQDILAKLRLDGSCTLLFAAMSREIAAELPGALAEMGCFVDEPSEEKRQAKAESFASFYAAGLFGVIDAALVQGELIKQEDLEHHLNAALDFVAFPEALTTPRKQ